MLTPVAETNGAQQTFLAPTVPAGSAPSTLSFNVTATSSASNLSASANVAVVVNPIQDVVTITVGGLHHVESEIAGECDGHYAWNQADLHAEHQQSCNWQAVYGGDGTGSSGSGRKLQCHLHGHQPADKGNSYFYSRRHSKLRRNRGSVSKPPQSRVRVERC